MSDEKDSAVYDRHSVEQTVSSSFKEFLNKFEVLWNEFGIDENQRAERVNVIVAHLLNLMGELVTEESKFCDDLKIRIESYFTELQELSQSLSVTPEMPDESSSLLKKEKFLRLQLDELDKERHRRLKDFKKLKKKELSLCNYLGISASDIGNNAEIPSKEDLSILQQQIFMLEEEYVSRSRKFLNSKKELTTIMEITELPPETSFERDVVCYEDEHFILSEENLDRLKRTIESVKEKRERVEIEIENLMQRLEILWNRLNVDEDYRTSFLTENSKCCTSTLTALEREIEKYEEIKKQNIDQYIQKLRDELKDLWEKCCVSEETQQQFRPFYDDECTEELLDFHDTEVQILKKYYDDTKHIFEKIEKRSRLWTLMLHLEQKSTDPNRFTNRGGNLLQEERERKKIMKDLPNLEKEILEDIGQYEGTNNSKFLIYGKSFTSYVADQWESCQREKETKKLERQKIKTMQLGADLKVSSKPSLLSTLATTSSHGSTTKTPTKKTSVTTPATVPSKTSRTSSNSGTVRSTRKFLSRPISKSATKASFVKTKRGEVKRKVHIVPSKGPNQSSLTDEKDSYTDCDSGESTSYSVFAKELNKTSRVRYRSSAVPRKLGSKVTHSGKFKRNLYTRIPSSKSHK